MHNIVCIGLISKPLGIKGQVKVISYTESPDSLFKYNNLSLHDNTSISFTNYKLISNNIFIASIYGVNDRNGSEQYRLKEVYINRKDLPELNNNECYYDDLINMKVLDINNNVLGTVKSILNYGAGDFLEIIMENNKDATISFNKDTILNIDVQNNTIVINEKYLLI